MNYLLILKAKMQKFYGRFEVYITPTLKFLLALVAFSCINSKLSFMPILTRPAVVVIGALLCSFLPVNTVVIFSALAILAHCFKASIYIALVVAVFFILLLLLYFRFSPKDVLAVILTPICFTLKIPYVMPIAMGLTGTPASAIGVGVGVMVYYVVDYVASAADSIQTVMEYSNDSILIVVAYLIDGVVANAPMIVCAIAFAATVIVVYVIRMLSINYSWIFAMVAGALTNLLILFIGDLKLVTNVSIGGAFLGNLIAIALCFILQFFVFNVDYNRTEHVQFEDDEYYYYVKAVPKVVVKPRDITAEQKAARAAAKQHRRGASSKPAAGDSDYAEEDEEEVRVYSRKK